MAHKIIHGKSNHPMLNSYHEAKYRCTVPHGRDWSRYGGRGIKFLLGSPAEFVVTMQKSWTEGTSLGRIDNNADYTYDNIQWETPKQQARNRVTNVNYTYGGETMCATDWAARLGMSTAGIKHRVKRWGVEAALSKPAKFYRAEVSTSKARAKSTLTIDDVRLIRSDARTIRELARVYNVSPTSIQSIKSGKTWKGL